ncbi:MAG TPA: methyl-accepting chemotaxis protein [Chloroflexota bacterium]|nr:methyl-accepting chemotaxis protein [Chloroflexota bacterium]
MTNPTYRRQRLLYLTLGLAVAVFIALFVVLFRVISDAATGDVSKQTQATASTSAQAIASSIQNDVQLAAALAGQDGIVSLLQDKAGSDTIKRINVSTLGFQRANPQLGAVYLFDARRTFILGQVHDVYHLYHGVVGATCDQNKYCNLASPPTQGYMATDQMQANLDKVLRPGASAIEPLVFGPLASPYGDFYVFQPIPAPTGHAILGALVEQIDGTSLFSPYIQNGTSGSVILDGNVAIGPGIVAAHQRGLLPVTQPLSTLAPATSGKLIQTTGLVAAPTILSPNDPNPRFAVAGTTVQGSVAPVGMSSLQVVSYTALGSLSASATRSIIGVGIFFLLLIAFTVGMYLYQGRRVQRAEQKNALAMRARSDALTEDIVSVSQALAVAREGDLTVEIPPSDSEVGLLSLSLNGLISDYGLIVGGIVQASQAVQEGAARVDVGVRKIVDAATNQAEEVALVAARVEDVATSAVEVQQGTQTATTLAGHARQAVQSGQESVGRIAEAVDSIKEAAIGTTREFKRLQEDSIRLTALVASVKSNAENLDMQAANATLEARHLGTESGSAFATNIGRLARQAQDTLADAEGAVRSVVTSIDEVNRRIERISEQVRRGVEEVRTVRATFDDVTHTNSSLVQFIDSVADSASIQSQSALEAAQSISQIAQVFEQFTEQLVASGDEIANMRLIVAGLRESVADLRVSEPEPEPAPAPRLNAESAA